MKRLFWLTGFLLACTGLQAQYSDGRLWLSASVRWNVTKKIRLTLEEEARFYQNISQLDRLNTELTASFDLAGPLEAGILYRLISAREPEGYFDFGHRVSLFLGVEKNLFGWDCMLKSSFQQTFGTIGRSEGWYLPERYVRTEAEVAHTFLTKKNEPFINFEFWYRVPAGKPDFIDQYRLTAGFRYRLNKRNRVEVFYRYQKELQVADPLTGHIVGAGYRYYIR